MLDGVCVFYGEVQADATMFARRKQVANAKGRSEDWLIVATGGCGRRGQELGVGESLGDLDFTNEEAVKEIIKSARSARDMAILNRDTPIVWLVHSHKHALLFVVWAQSSESVVAECVGHCRNPLAAKNVVLGVADCADLSSGTPCHKSTLKLVHLGHLLIDKKKKPEKELSILATPPSVHPALQSLAVGLIRVAPNAEASKRRRITTHQQSLAKFRRTLEDIFAKFEDPSATDWNAEQGSPGVGIQLADNGSIALFELEDADDEENHEDGDVEEDEEYEDLEAEEDHDDADAEHEDGDVEEDESYPSSNTKRNKVGVGQSILILDPQSGTPLATYKSLRQLAGAIGVTIRAVSGQVNPPQSPSSPSSLAGALRSSYSRRPTPALPPRHESTYTTPATSPQSQSLAQIDDELLNDDEVVNHDESRRDNESENYHEPKNEKSFCLLMRSTTSSLLVGALLFFATLVFGIIDGDLRYLPRGLQDMESADIAVLLSFISSGRIDCAALPRSLTKFTATMDDMGHTIRGGAKRRERQQRRRQQRDDH
ncbi:hypothetical protein BDZ88DRAFT_436242 [Geranomyces variabilis]|nr:hypothetical protein BDZ88DRAFT_436242 [Geranomyces variabilis]KAJ3135536.1 hypothetical protein HDU90_003939 [Geranomyces variabilis]